MRAPDRLYRFEPGPRLPFDIHDRGRKPWFPHQRPQTYARRSDAEHRLRRTIESGWYPEARLYISNEIVWTPENVECQTCGGQQTWTDSDDGDWFACPDCTPENVECQTCGDEVLIAGKFGIDPLGIKRCPDCTPENVEEP